MAVGTNPVDPHEDSSALEQRSEYLVTLQPSATSKLLQALKSTRARCAAAFGLDETHLYPPHVSVTGFFQATASQAARVCKALPQFVADHTGEDLEVAVGDFVATPTGYVILEIIAPGIASFSQRLVQQTAEFGLHVRSKNCKHLSLASGRTVEEQSRILSFYPAGASLAGTPFDLVISRLGRRSRLFRSPSGKRVRSDGSHAFVELLRIPLPTRTEPIPAPVSCPEISAALQKFSADPLQPEECHGTPIPWRKRLGDLHPTPEQKPQRAPKRLKTNDNSEALIAELHKESISI